MVSELNYSDTAQNFHTVSHQRLKPARSKPWFWTENRRTTTPMCASVQTLLVYYHFGEIHAPVLLWVAFRFKCWFVMSQDEFMFLLVYIWMYVWKNVPAWRLVTALLNAISKFCHAVSIYTGVAKSCFFY